MCATSGSELSKGSHWQTREWRDSEVLYERTKYRFSGQSFAYEFVRSQEAKSEDVLQHSVIQDLLHRSKIGGSFFLSIKDSSPPDCDAINTALHLIPADCR